MVLAIVLFMLDCTKNIAGSEVTNERFVATIYLPNGQPAKNASVLILPANYVPSSTLGLGKTSATKLSYLGTQTDNLGHFSVKGLVDGCYNVSATQDSLVMFHDSIFIATDLLQSSNDTLHSPASLNGIVKIQPNHNVTTVIVQALGTDLYANVDTKGRFTFPKLAKGEYQVKFSTSLDSYTPKFISVGIHFSKPDTLLDTVTLDYTGIPVVTGIKAVFDSSNGTVRIQWDTVNYSNLSAFVVYRAPFDLIQSPGTLIGGTMNTFFIDSSIRNLDSGSYHYKYRVAILDNSISMGAFYKFADITVYSPGALSVHIITKPDTVSFSGSLKVKARIISPRGPIRNVEWRILSEMSNTDSLYKDTLLQKNEYPKATSLAIDSVIVNNRENYTIWYSLACKATDSWGDTSTSIIDIVLFQNPILDSLPIFNINIVQNSGFFDSTCYVDSTYRFASDIHNAQNPIIQIQWAVKNPDSILKSTTLQETFINYSDTLNFSWSIPGIKTIYCSFTDSLRQFILDSLKIRFISRQ
jgi:hypothetical protein